MTAVNKYIVTYTEASPNGRGSLRRTVYAETAKEAASRVRWVPYQVARVLPDSEWDNGSEGEVGVNKYIVIYRKTHEHDLSASPKGRGPHRKIVRANTAKEAADSIKGDVYEVARCLDKSEWS